MKESRASVTALGVAMWRAAHQLQDTPKVFDDPVALSIIGTENEMELKANPYMVMNVPNMPGVRAFIAVRSRYTEDQLALSIELGIRQYVILGAGFDTFAYRNPYPVDNLQVYEVDQSATQKRKQEHLANANITIPSNLTFVPIDFERQTLAEGLRDAGYDPDLPTFFSFLGVSYYLTLDGFIDTLRFIASGPIGSGVVFDYILDPSLLTQDIQIVLAGVRSSVAAMGEPWQTFFKPDELIATLHKMGFSQTVDLSPVEINSKYFADHQSLGLHKDGFNRLMCARK